MQATREPPEQPMDDVVAGIGPKVRKLRQEKSLSLQQLAERARVSAAAIHKIERNGMVPTVATLMKIAAALNRSVAYFVEEDEDGDKPAVMVPARARRPVFTSKQGLELQSVSGPYGRFLLAGAMAAVEPAADSGPVPMEHPGEELVYVLHGGLEFQVEDETFTLSQGDALHFRTDRPHRWRNPRSKPARALWLAIRSR